MKRAVIAVVLSLLLVTPLTALARGGGGGGGFSGGGRGGGGFDMSQDTHASRPPASSNASRPSGNNTSSHGNSYNTNASHGNTYNTNANHGNTYNTNANHGNTYNTNANHGNTYNTNVNHNVNNVNVNRTVVANPVYGGSAWGWNHGVAWAPAAGYWGGGFWGAFAIGVTSAAVYGSIVNANNQTITSYQVQPSSPGATLLSNYHLTQTQCGPPNLVVIYGPNNSAICAYPNDLVTAGSYSLDSSNLSLVSQ